MPSRLNNGGIVGPFQQETESGIWSVDSNIVTGPRYIAAINGSTFNEGDNVVITISATNLFENSTIRFTINGIESADVQGVSGGSITGTSPYSGLINVTASGGTGSGQLTLTLSEDLEAEGTEVYSIIFDDTDSLEYPAGLDYTQFNITVIDTSVTKTIGFDADEAIYDVANSSFVYADENGFTVDEGKQYKILFFARNLLGSINWSLSPASNTDIDIVSGTSTTPTLETIGFDNYYRHEVTFNTNEDFLLEGSEEYTFIIRYQPDITIESTLAFTLSDTSRPDVYLLNSPATSIIEGQTLTLQVNSIYPQLSYVVRDENGNTTNEFETSNNVIIGISEGSSLKGAEIFTAPGTFDWEVPLGVTSISAVAVGGGGGGSASTTSSNGISGGGGGGGALHYNTFAVTPGETLTIVVGSGGVGGSGEGQNNATSGTESAIKRGASYILRAGGGVRGLYAATSGFVSGGTSSWVTLGGGGGNGGNGGAGSSGNSGGGGGGAGGYSGNGGSGAIGTGNGTSGTGGGGAGASGTNNLSIPVTFGGGGVGIFGEGASGNHVKAVNRQANSGSTPGNIQTQLYGGGGSGAEDDSPSSGGNGAPGAVRIIIGGDEYPTSNTEVLEGFVLTDSIRQEYQIFVRAKYDSVTEPNVNYSVLIQDGSVAPENINANTAIFSHNFTLGNLLTYQLDEPSSNTVTVDENTVQIIKIKMLASIEDPKWRLVEENTSLRDDGASPIIVLNEQSFDSVTSVTANSAVDIFADGTQLKESVLKIYSTEQGGQTTAKIEIYFPSTGHVLDTITFNILEASPVVDHTYYNVRWEHQPFNVSRTTSTTSIAYTNSASIIDNYYPLVTLTEGDLDLVNIRSGTWSNVGYTDIYRYTIPRDGIYELVCRGGRGGSRPPQFDTPYGAAAITVGRKVFKRGDLIYGVAGAGGGCTRIVSNNDTSLTADILIVGGGGAGGHLGGGGAGGHRYFTNESLVPTTLYTVTVGEGGIGSTSATGASGSSSVFDAYTSAGGGGGAGEAALPTPGGSGGGGGGLAGTSRPGAAGNTPTTSPAQGGRGGDGIDNGAGTAFAGGGGGAATYLGANAQISSGTPIAGDGGLGTPNSITGTSVTRAAGGGGGAYIIGGTAIAGLGGWPSGGNGGRNGLNATSGSPNTGSGGGGNGLNSSGNLQGSSGGGGSGVVILKYPSIFNISNPGGGLTSTTDSSSVAGYKITTFTAGTGTISFETPEPSIAYAISGGGGMSAWFYYPNNNIADNDVQPIPLMVAGGGGGWTEDRDGVVSVSLNSQASLTTIAKSSNFAGGSGGLPGNGFTSQNTTAGGGRGGAGWNAFRFGTFDTLFGKGPWNDGVGWSTINSPFVGGTREDYTTTLDTQHTYGYIVAGGWGGGGGATADAAILFGAPTPTSRGAGGGGGYSGGGGSSTNGTLASFGGGGGSYVSNELSQTSIFLDINDVNSPAGFGTSAQFDGYIWINLVE